MAEEKKGSDLVREILVAIDTSAHSQAALEAAITLARTMEANIQGLFVQDEVWQKLSQLPSTKTVNTLTGDVLPFESDTLEDHLTLMRNRLRRKLEYLSSRNQITYSWSSIKGNVENKILEASKNADLITIGLKGKSASRKRIGSSAKTIIKKAGKPVLILKRGLHLGTTLTVVYDASEESQKALKLALKIARKNNSSLKVLVVDNNPEAMEQRNKELEQLLEGVSISVQIDLIKNTDLGSFLNSINRQHSGLLIVPKNQPLLSKSFETILLHINCPLLMVS
ncbi:MAG: universal stress protein [Balneolaceae bacterium]|nr:universal stress protein [Balneolaceae bacterium]